MGGYSSGRGQAGCDGHTGARRARPGPLLAVSNFILKGPPDLTGGQKKEPVPEGAGSFLPGPGA